MRDYSKYQDNYFNPSPEALLILSTTTSVLSGLGIILNMFVLLTFRKMGGATAGITLLMCISVIDTAGCVLACINGYFIWNHGQLFSDVYPTALMCKTWAYCTWISRYPYHVSRVPQTLLSSICFRYISSSKVLHQAL